jgi:hypothetical protein
MNVFFFMFAEIGCRKYAETQIQNAYAKETTK